MKNMSVDYCSCDPDYLEQVKEVERNIFLSNRNSNQAMYFWNHNVVHSSLKIMAKDKIRRKDLFRELMNENSVAELINQGEDNILGDATKYTQMRDLGKQEATLKTNIESIVHRIQKLKSTQNEGRNLNIKKRLEMQRNFAKASKKLTVASFEYQGPNISGFIGNGDNFQLFDLNPNKINKQDMSKYLWECLNRANTVDWFNIFNNDII